MAKTDHAQIYQLNLDPHTKEGRANCFSILSINRQINEEASEVLCSQNIFGLVMITTTRATIETFHGGLNAQNCIATIDGKLHYEHFRGYIAICYMVDKEVAVSGSRVVSIVTTSQAQLRTILYMIGAFDHKVFDDCRPLRHLTAEIVLNHPRAHHVYSWLAKLLTEIWWGFRSVKINGHMEPAIARQLETSIMSQKYETGEEFLEHLRELSKAGNVPFVERRYHVAIRAWERTVLHIDFAMPTDQHARFLASLPPERYQQPLNALLFETLQRVAAIQLIVAYYLPQRQQMRQFLHWKSLRPLAVL